MTQASQNLMPPTKLFVSHASEDKADFVEPLVKALEAVPFKVWYDKYELTLGDSLRGKIDQGLKECDFGVVVLSPYFFAKKWPQAELDGLLALETTNRKVILPIWKDVTVEDVTASSPILAGRLGSPTTGGIDVVVADIQRAVQSSERMATFSNAENAISRFKALDQQIAGGKRSEALSNSAEGVRIVAEAAQELVTALRRRIEEVAAGAEVLQIKFDDHKIHQLSFSGSYNLRFVLRYENNVSNSIQNAELRLFIYQNLDPWGGDFTKRKTLCVEEFEPKFDHTSKLIWQTPDGSSEFTTEQLEERIVDEAVDAFTKLYDKATKRSA